MRESLRSRSSPPLHFSLPSIATAQRGRAPAGEWTGQSDERLIRRLGVTRARLKRSSRATSNHRHTNLPASCPARYWGSAARSAECGDDTLGKHS